VTCVIPVWNIYTVGLWKSTALQEASSLKVLERIRERAPPWATHFRLLGTEGVEVNANCGRTLAITKVGYCQSVQLAPDGGWMPL
jgi:hypothetical protein